MNKALVFVGIAVLAVIVVGGIFFVMSSTKNATVPVVPVPIPSLNNQNALPAAQTPPEPANQIKLTISAPADKAVVTAPDIKVTGQTVPGADVSINEVDTKADASGNFSANLTLSEGDNPIVVDAFDADGNTSEQTITVTYQTTN